MKLSILLATLCLSVPAFAGVTNVTHAGYFATLTQAVAAATSGDRLLVSTGAYFGNLLIAAKDLTIAGGYLLPDFSTRVWIADDTVISTNTVAPVVFVDQSARVNLENLRITGGGIFLLWGGGIFVGDNCVVSAYFCRIDHNTSLFGGGGAVWSNAHFAATDVWIDHNTALLEGGGLYGYLDARLVLNGPGGKCFDNFAPRGGAVTLFGSMLTVAETYSFDGNVAAERGGALYLFGGARAEIAPNTTFGWSTPNNVTNGDGGCVYAESSTFVMHGDEAALTIMDGFSATRNGGAIYLSNSTCTLADYVQLIGLGITSTPCVFGGGICALDSTLTLSNNVSISGCAAAAGGGIASERSTLTLLDDISIGDANFLMANTALTAGGGVYARACTTTVVRSRILGNMAQQMGGGIALGDTGACILVDSVVAGNATVGTGLGGGLCGLLAVGPCVFDHTAVVSNGAFNAGGGIYWFGAGALTLSNGTQLCDNAARFGAGGGAYVDLHGTLSLHDLQMARNCSGSSGGGLFVQTGMVTCTACTFDANCANLMPTNSTAILTTGGGGAALMSGSALTAINCTWRDNHVSNAYGSGGAILAHGARLGVDSTFGGGPAGMLPPTQFIGNRAGVSNSAGGAIAVFEGAVATIAHAILVSNTAMNGGAIAVENAAVTLENLVIAQNHADNSAGGLIIMFPRQPPTVRQCTIAQNDHYGFDGSGGTTTFQNCVFWGNQFSQIAPEALTAIVTYCDIETGYSGTGNIDSNPFFVAAAALNYDLGAGSPCRDAGMSLPTVTNDCIGTPRPYSSGWDMGAYEFVPEPGGVLLLAVLGVVRATRRTRAQRHKRHFLSSAIDPHCRLYHARCHKGSY